MRCLYMTVPASLTDKMFSFEKVMKVDYNTRPRYTSTVTYERYSVLTKYSSILLLCAYMC